MSWPQNIGILGLEIYFPSSCVDQAELEKFDGVAPGKYTIGLGQTRMSYCDDREDIYSFALTAVHNLLDKYNIDTNSIGRLEVGTETILDKSKSVKSVLMQLFGENHNIEGVDTVNACYGGTNALFNAANWIESSAWDGRNAIVVAGDIALYAKGAARPTGGAGCVAMLVGPNAPIVLEPGLRGTFMQHAYDFFDGQYSIVCYTRALDASYRNYQKRLSAKPSNSPSAEEGADRFSYAIFHAPTCKLVQKSYARLFYVDYLRNPSGEQFKDIPAAVNEVQYEPSLTDKNVEKAFMALTKEKYEQRVKGGLLASTMAGNMYCASLYAGLVSLICNYPPQELQGKKVAAFSYGSGLASSFFSLNIRGDVSKIAATVGLQSKLDSRAVLAPKVYDETMLLREKAHLQKGYTPTGDISRIAKGTYYLTSIDDKFRREYSRKA